MPFALILIGLSIVAEVFVPSFGGCMFLPDLLVMNVLFDWFEHVLDTTIRRD